MHDSMVKTRFSMRPIFFLIRIFEKNLEETHSSLFSRKGALRKLSSGVRKTRKTTWGPCPGPDKSFRTRDQVIPWSRCVFCHKSLKEPRPEQIR